MLVEFVRAAIVARNNASGKIEAIDAKVQKELEELKQRYVDNQITKDFFNTEKARIEAGATEERLSAMNLLEAVQREYEKTINDWAMPKSGQLDRDILWILENVSLTAEQFDALSNQFRCNVTMTAAIENAKKKKCAEINKSNAGRPLNQQIEFQPQFYPQTPETRKALFHSFIDGLKHSLTKYCDMRLSDGTTAANMESWVNYRAKDVLSKLEPIEDAEQPFNPEEFPVEILPEVEPNIW